MSWCSRGRLLVAFDFSYNDGTVKYASWPLRSQYAYQLPQRAWKLCSQYSAESVFEYIQQEPESSGKAFLALETGLPYLLFRCAGRTWKEDSGGCRNGKIGARLRTAVSIDKKLSAKDEKKCSFLLMLGYIGVTFLLQVFDC